jgi:hypothetical protein
MSTILMLISVINFINVLNHSAPLPWVASAWAVQLPRLEYSAPNGANLIRHIFTQMRCVLAFKTLPPKKLVFIQAKGLAFVRK